MPNTSRGSTERYTKMVNAADFGLGIAESARAEIWEPLITDAANGMLDLIESRLAEHARATGNVHSVTGYYTIERIYGNG